MKRKILTIVVLCITLLCCIVGLTACGGGGSGGGYNNTYYKYSGGKYDEKNTFTLNNGKWEQEQTIMGVSFPKLNGKYEIKDGEIIFYASEGGETAQVNKGTITEGVIKIGSDYYCAKGYTPDGKKDGESGNGNGNSGGSGGNGGNSGQESGISFKTFSVTGTTVFGKVSNGTTSFSFINEIQTYGGTTFTVSVNSKVDGQNILISSIVNLDVGDNVFYVLDSTGINYTVTIRRRPIYIVSFDTNGGTPVASQNVEEDSIITAPNTVKAGYHCTWDYDFSLPITFDKFITASWSPNTDTPYKVEHYLENIEDDNYTLFETENLTGTTDTNVTAAAKSYENYTNVIGAISNNLSADGSLVIKHYYTRNRYTVTLESSVNDANSVSGGGSFKVGKKVTISSKIVNGTTWLGWYKGEMKITGELSYAFDMPAKNVNFTAKWAKVNLDKNINDAGTINDLVGNFVPGDNVTITANTNLGYTWLGWYNGETKLTDKQSYSFKMPSESVTYIAKWEVKLEMANFNFTSTTTTCTVTGIKEDAPEELIFPACVTSIGNRAFAGNSTIKKVNIAENVSSIQYGAFSNCSSLQDAVIKGNGNLTIAKDAFLNCSNLTNVSISGSLYQIGVNAFYGCSSLVKVNYIGTIDSWCEIDFYNSFANPLYYAKNLYINDELVTEANITTATKINAYAFSYCRSLTSITIPDSVKSIGSSAFSGCSSFESITIPFVGGGTSNTHFGYIFGASSFYENKTYVPASLKTVVITGGSSIGYGAFYNCSSLTSITIPDSVTSIGNNAFYNCSSLTSITIPDSVTRIGSYAFYNFNNLLYNEYDNAYYLGNDNNPYLVLIEAKSTNITSCAINKNTKVIYSDAFYNCSSLTSITIPDSVTSIGNNAFYNCQIESATIPDFAISYIPKTNLRTVEITSGERIEESAFYDCRSLTSITIPDVIWIGGYAFLGCSSLTSITIPDSVMGIGEYAFVGCYKLVEVYNKSLLNIVAGGEDNGCVGNYALAVYTDEYESKVSTDDNGYIIYTDGEDKILVGYSGGESELTIPDGITEINKFAFLGNEITKVTIPDSVTSIGSYAFSDCSSLTSVTFANPNGWKAGSTSLSSGDLSNASTAATYLKSTYLWNTWTRS